MISSLQSLRFIFALMIFFHHYAINGVGLFPAGGACGVSFFIILSGFVMSAGYDEKITQPGFKYKDFIFKRLIRIYPLHLLCLLGFIIIHISHLGILDYIKLTPNLLLLQSWIPIKSIYFSGNAVSWCLSDMLFFYAIFPLLSKCMRKCNKRTACILGSIIVIVYFIIALLMPDSYSHQILYISPIFRLIDFIIGMCTYKLYIKISESDIKDKILNQTYVTKSLIEAVLIFLLVVPVMLYPHISDNIYYSFIWWYIMPELILLFALFDKQGGVFSKILNYRILVFIGGYSFTFYMVHQMGISIIHSIINKLSFNIIPAIVLIFTFIVILIVSYITYKFYEIPVSKYLKNKLTWTK